MRKNSSLYGDGQFHFHERTGEYRKVLRRNLKEIKLPSGTTVYEVKYSLHNLKTQKRYSTLEEAEQFMAMCQNLLDRERLSRDSKIDENEILEYPETVLRNIGIDSNTEGYYEFIVPEFEERFEKASEMLTPREKEAIIDYYKNMRTLEQCGDDFGITRERFRQILSKAMRKLRHPHYRNELTIPKDKYYLISNEEKEKMIAEFKEKLETEFKDSEYERALEIVKKHEEEENKEKANKYLDYKLDQMDLSTRTWSCLRRAGIETVREIVDKTVGDMMKVRNLGKKSLKELEGKLASYGLALRGEQCN